MKKFNTRLLLILLILSVSSTISYAQHGPGPFPYQPPQGVNRWTDPSSSEYIYKEVSMNLLSALNSTDDALMVSFDMKLSLDEEGKPLVAFTDPGSGNNILEIVYSKRTVTITRYKTINGQRVSYDYHLFDPIFENIGEDVSARWHFSAFFTSTSLYIVCSTIGDGVKNLMSPIFFGLDDINRYPNINSIMYKFIGRNNQAIIKLGDSQSQSGFQSYISNIKVNSLNNAEWTKTMQKEFASGGGLYSNSQVILGDSDE